MASSTATPKKCPRCTDIATKACTGCRSISYCSIECQQAEWPAHKVLCRTLKDFQQRPSPESRRIVVFLPGESKPRFMWAPVERIFAGYHPGAREAAFYETIHESSVTDAKHTFTPYDSDRNVWTGEPLGYTIQMLCDDNFSTNYSESNKAVASATQGKSAVDWRGPIFAFCGRLRGGNFDAVDIVEVQDMGMEAYSQLVAFLIDHYSRPDVQKVRKGPKVECVKIASNRDIQELGAHQLVRVPPSHPMFEGKGSLSEISSKIQLPLVFWECPSARAESRDNPRVVAMQHCCDPTLRNDADIDTPTFGYANKRFYLDVGTHIVARITGLPLDCDTVDAFGDYCRFHLPPYFQFCREEGDDLDDLDPRRKEHRQKVMDQITPAKWIAYLAQWKAEKLDAAAAKAHRDRIYTLEKARSGIDRMGVSADDSERIQCILFNMHDHHLEMYKQRYGDE